MFFIFVSVVYCTNVSSNICWKNECISGFKRKKRKEGRKEKGMKGGKLTGSVFDTQGEPWLNKC